MCCRINLFIVEASVLCDQGSDQRACQRSSISLGVILIPSHVLPLVRLRQRS